MQNTFICLLPSEEGAAQLHRKLNALFSIHVFPYIKLPLHVTLYFFPKSTLKNNANAISWIQHASRVSKGPIIANIRKVRCFKKDKQDFVYHLPITSEAILHLHDDLFSEFRKEHADFFDFIPHLSLFYPDRNLTEKERDFVQKIYRDMESITFDRLALAAEKKNGTHLLNVQAL